MILKTIRITEDFPELDRVNALALEAFPPEEYMAPARMIEMSRNGMLDFFALYDGDSFVGFVAIRTYQHIAYLFFLAIEKGFRSRGYGSATLEMLRNLYPGYQQVVDFEMLDESAENSEQRKRRRLFYLRNGYKPTGRFMSYFGVDYEIFCSDDDFDFPLFNSMMSSIKVKGFNLRFFEEKDI